MSDPADVWVTVPEAARRLGIGERRAYRLASGLSDSDRQMSDKRQTLVRQAALAALLGRRPVESEGGEQASDSVRHSSDSAGAGVGHPSDMAQQLVDQLRSENAYLRAALEREQANTAAALGQLRDADARLAAVLAASGRLALQPGEVAAEQARGTSGGEAPSREAAQTEDAVDADSGPGGKSAARDGEGGSTGRTEAPARRSLWARLWGRG